MARRGRAGARARRRAAPRRREAPPPRGRAAAGVACRYHDLRHTYAAHLVAAGVHPKALQRLLGHATIGVTLDTYGHLLPEALDDAVAALDTVLARESQRAVWGQCGDGEP